MSDDDDAVGYGKPPKRHRFKEGESGNQKGRPKGSRNVATLLKKAMDERIQVSVKGKRKNMTKREALFHQLVNKAVSGDHRSIVASLDLLHRLEAAVSENPAQGFQFSQADQDVLAGIRMRLMPEEGSND